MVSCQLIAWLVVMLDGHSGNNGVDYGEYCHVAAAQPQLPVRSAQRSKFLIALPCVPSNQQIAFML